MSTFPIDLIGDLIVVKPEPIRSGIRLPDWKMSLHGTILARGPKVTSVEQGNRVSFGAAVGMDSVYAGEAIRILREDDLDLVYEA